MSRNGFRRTAAVAAQVVVLIATFGCESGPATGPTAPGETSTVPPVPASGSVGALGGTVTVNGEAFPLAWVETVGGWASATTMPRGSWEWERMPAGDYVVVIKTPLGLTCDATSKSATVRKDQRTVVNFACFGDVKGSIVGIASNEFGTASARITLTGPVNRETISNKDGFFAFENLPPGEYSIKWCAAVSASVRDGASAFVMLDCS